MSRISRFNPYMMDDELILALNTGRENELAFIQEIIAHNVEGGGPPQHILLHGPRGIGKSFFLRLLQIRVRHDERIAFVLLPEEQLNVYQPGDLLQAIKNTLTGESDDAGISMWAREGVEAWRREWAALEAVREAQGHPHLVVGLENFDLLFKKGGAFEHSEDQFQLREFLSETPWLTLIATSLYPDLDIHYKDALFQFFAKCELRPWQEVQHEAYLRKRNRLEGRETTPISLAQLKALTRFTGGHPRITVIMADVLADNQVESAALTLDKTIDELTPFYQDLLNRIPPKSKKLFDALIRGGEPCSQSALAARVGTAQSVIAQSFNWLQTHGYLLAERPKGERQKLYSVRDRLFAHFYRMRYILQGSGRSILSVMSEFLTHFYDSQELKGQALEFYERGDEASSRELMHIALESTGIDPEALAWRDDIQALLEAIDLSDVDDIDIPKTQEEARDLLIRIRDLLAASTNTPSAINPEEFAHTLFGSVGLSFEEKMQTAKKCITGKILADNWIQLEQDLEAEAHQHQRWGGNIYISLRDHLANGDIFFEFLEDEALEHIRNEDPDLYHLLNAFNLFAPTFRPLSRQAEIRAHQHLLNLNRAEANKSAQAWNLDQIGWHLSKFGRFEDAIDAHKQALQLKTETGDIPGHARSLGQIGLNLSRLGRFEEALDAHKQALKLKTETGDIPGQAWSFNQIGTSLSGLGSFEEAIDAHKQALQLWSQVDYPASQAWSTAQVAVNYLLAQDERAAWAWIASQRPQDGWLRHRAFKYLGNAVCFYDQRSEIAKAYTMGRQILNYLREHQTAYEINRALQVFFTYLLEEKTDFTLVEDLLDAALDLFGEEIALDLEGIHGVIEYLKSGKDVKVGLKMAPEKRQVVAALVEELNL